MVLLHPCDDPFASDEEEGEDDIGLAGSSNVDNDSDDNNEQTQTKGNKRNWRDGTRVFDVNWYQNDEICNVAKDFPQLVDNNSELELYKLFYDDKVEQLFGLFKKKYATTQQNDPTFTTDRTDLWDFVTILTFSSYNTRPQFGMYWSNDADLSSPFCQRAYVEE